MRSKDTSPTHPALTVAVGGSQLRGRTRRFAGLFAGLFAAPLALGACTEEPSFYLRWQITTDPALVELSETGDVSEVPVLRSAKDCSDVGIQRVRINLFDKDTTFVFGGGGRADTISSTGRVIEATDYWDFASDSASFACFPSDFASSEAMAAGPTVSPGEYFAHVIALRRDGTPWPCEATVSNYEGSILSACPSGYVPVEEASDLCTRACGPGMQRNQDDSACVACPGHAATPNFSITETKPHRFDPVTFLAPLPCTDEIDNDRDGRTDEADLACQLDPLADEDEDAGVTLFSLSLSLLDSENAKCSNVGITNIRLSIDPDLAAGEQETASESTEIMLPCQDLIPVFSKRLGEGSYLLSATGVDPQGGDITDPQTLDPFVVDPTEAGYVDRAISFLDTDFPAGLSSRIEISLTHRSYASSNVLWACEPPIAFGGLLGGIETVDVQIRDAEGVALDVATLGIDDAVDAEEGITFSTCPTASLLTEVLDWGTYQVEAQGKIDGVVCYATTQPFSLAPNEHFPILVDRVVNEEGVPPPGCLDCDEDGDCGPTYACVDQICKGQ